MDKIGYWKGQPISELPREQLLEVIEWLASEVQRYQKIMENKKIKSTYYDIQIDETLK